MNEIRPGSEPVAEQADAIAPFKATTSLVYLLQALSFLLGFTSVIGVVVNYLRLADVRGTWLETHFVWQIRTFWFQLLWGLIGLVTSVFLIGFLIWGGSVLLDPLSRRQGMGQSCGGAAHVCRMNRASRGPCRLVASRQLGVRQLASERTRFRGLGDALHRVAS